MLSANYKGPLDSPAQCIAIPTILVLFLAIMAVGPVSQSHGASALPLARQLSKDHDHVLKTFRLLISDLCQQFGGGHPG